MGVPLVLNKLTESEAASSKTLDAFAEVIRALAPEVCSVSFHDVAADTLLLSEDFLLPEDHQLVEECLASDATGMHSIQYGTARRLALFGRHPGPRSARRGQRRRAPEHRLRRSSTRARRSRWSSGSRPSWCASRPSSSAAAPRRRCPPRTSSSWRKSSRRCDAERFELFLQPILPLRDVPGMAHYEVLLRLRTLDGGLFEPAAFLGAAAHRNLMPAIDRWVVRTLLVWLVNNRDLWSQVPSVFCINLASQSMTDANFISYVESCVQKSGLPPQALCFEITERFASSGNISVAESMKRLEALGCEVALDDFGANAPSYGYLRTVPAHYFKIDSSLVVAAPTDRVARAVISSIVRMASDLGVQTVAESVESDTRAAGRARARRRLCAGVS